MDANLFFHCRIDQQERVRMLAGRLRGGGTRPVPDELLHVLRETNLGHYRHWLIAGLDSGDLGVARTLIGRLKLRIPAARLRLLVAVWQRGGPDAVREILALDRLPVTLRRQTEKLLDLPDGLDRLRARLAAEEDPEKLLEFLNKAPGYDGSQPHKLTGDGIPLPWPELIVAYRSGSLTPAWPRNSRNARTAHANYCWPSCRTPRSWTATAPHGPNSPSGTAHSPPKTS